MDYDAHVNVMLKPGIADVQGQTIQRALPALGFDQVNDIKVGKRFLVRVAADSPEEAEKLVSEMCERLLANPVIESYEVSIA